MEKMRLSEVEGMLKPTQLVNGKDRDACLFWPQASSFFGGTDIVIYGALLLLLSPYCRETSKEGLAVPLDSHCMRIKNNEFFFPKRRIFQ